MGRIDLDALADRIALNGPSEVLLLLEQDVREALFFSRQRRGQAARPRPDDDELVLKATLRGGARKRPLECGVLHHPMPKVDRVLHTRFGRRFTDHIHTAVAAGDARLVVRIHRRPVNERKRLVGLHHDERARSTFDHAQLALVTQLRTRDFRARRFTGHHLQHLVRARRNTVCSADALGRHEPGQSPCRPKLDAVAEQLPFFFLRFVVGVARVSLSTVYGVVEYEDEPDGQQQQQKGELRDALRGQATCFGWRVSPLCVLTMLAVAVGTFE